VAVLAVVLLFRQPKMSRKGDVRTPRRASKTGLGGPTRWFSGGAYLRITRLCLASARLRQHEVARL
jgi:hypothetical protein